MKLNIWLPLRDVKSETWELRELLISGEQNSRLLLYGRFEVELINSQVSTFYWISIPDNPPQLQTHLKMRFESTPGISPLEVELSEEEAEKLIEQLQIAAARHRDGPPPNPWGVLTRSQATDRFNLEA